jgi:hypothetical protein
MLIVVSSSQPTYYIHPKCLTNKHKTFDHLTMKRVTRKHQDTDGATIWVSRYKIFYILLTLFQIIDCFGFFINGWRTVLRCSLLLNIIWLCPFPLKKEKLVAPVRAMRATANPSCRYPFSRAAAQASFRQHVWLAVKVAARPVPLSSGGSRWARPPWFPGVRSPARRPSTAAGQDAGAGSIILKAHGQVRK